MSTGQDSAEESQLFTSLREFLSYIYCPVYLLDPAVTLDPRIPKETPVIISIAKMRLLDTWSYELTEFYWDKIPPYAILSHTWGDEEVLFPDIQNNTAQSKRGFRKLMGCCQNAIKDGFKWVWIDTCCIDKSSSAELSEAINSMYQWYRDSTICYAYLEDVTNVLSTPGTSSKHFTESRWFTRGWTLQELIAPRAVKFYTRAWEEIGTKGSLAAQIQATTRIPVRILCGEDVSTCVVAERMSWASKRQTARQEDMAYCLLGLFQINMPLLYGEGEKSFVRLQTEILRQDEDYSIFAWTLQEECSETTLMGCLASSPSQYANKVPGNISLPTLSGRPLIRADSRSTQRHDDYPGQPCYDSHGWQVLNPKSYEHFRKSDPGQGIAMPPTPPELTARGMRISLHMRSAPDPTLPAMAWLYCEVDEWLVCILLQTFVNNSKFIFGRFSSPWLVGLDKSFLSEFELTELLLFPSGFPNAISGRRPREHDRLVYGELNSRVRIELSPAQGYSTHVASTCPSHQLTQIGVSHSDECQDCGVLLIECTRGERDAAVRFQVSCGVLNGNPWCTIEEVLEIDQKAEGQHKISPDMMGWFGHLETRHLGLEFELGGYRENEARPRAMIPDRMVMESIQVPGMVVSARICPRASNWKGTPRFTLRVTVGELASCDG